MNLKHVYKLHISTHEPRWKDPNQKLLEPLPAYGNMAFQDNNSNSR